ncbi:hypothetical protein KIN20_031438 [Parelaphostrongylus tenuis]|uniref:Uncharacterized protein n=1 Tax=Parelaphostrongylus tenuis TaxID=148309 RepID=A0AAD5R5D7_PARTN|nr:hypothetical protein KIN20_031438 [Parelaphostrongylus tenuis]
MGNGQFGVNAGIPPPCPPPSGSAAVYNPSSLTCGAGFLWNYFPWGMFMLQQVLILHVLLCTHYPKYLARYESNTRYIAKIAPFFLQLKTWLLIPYHHYVPCDSLYAAS